MKVTILAIGSRGDVQPYVALGLGLQTIADVRIAARPHFEGMIRERGLGYHPVAEGFANPFGTTEGREWVQSRNNLASLRAFFRVIGPVAERASLDCLDACSDADVIVANPLGQVPGLHVAEKLRAPLVRALYCPMSATRAFPPDERWRPFRGRAAGTFNLAAHWVASHLTWLMYAGVANRVRRHALGHQPLSPFHPPADSGLVLYGFSENVVPRPADWGEHIQITGYWFLDGLTTWTPSPELVSFVEDGPPPICVDFGSMTARGGAEHLARVSIDALEATGQRGILLNSWDALGEGPVSESLFAARNVPHDWLFPHVAAVVHHGGAGTTAAAVRAGLPSVVVPFFADQPFWAARLQERGVAPPPLPYQHLTATNLADAVRKVCSSSTIHERAAHLGERVRAEHGVERAVEVFRQRFNRRGV